MPKAQNVGVACLVIIADPPVWSDESPTGTAAEVLKAITNSHTEFLCFAYIGRNAVQEESKVTEPASVL